MEFWNTLTRPRDRMYTDAISQATSNLRLYMQEAVLPAMRVADSVPALPPSGHKTHRNTLTVRPERWRRLESVQMVLDPHFCEQAVQFIDKCVPKFSLNVSDVDEMSGEELTVPCPKWFAIKQRVIGQAINLDRVHRWVQELPLETLQRIIHLVFPQTSEYTFEQAPVDVDHKLMRCLVWVQPSIDIESEYKPAMVVIVQPPWILSEHDLKLFTSCESFPHHDFGSKLRPSYRSKERLWAKVWDVCVRQNCRWFVLTTYWGWVFGAFSKGWTMGFVTEVYSFEHKMPTILESLLFWFASATGVTGGWVIPEVPEPIHNLEMNAPNSIPPPPSGRFIAGPPSESSWGGRSDVHDDSFSNENSADLREVGELLMSPAGVHNLQRLPFHEAYPPNPTLAQNVYNWQLGLTWTGAVPQEGHRPSRSPTPVPSISDLSDASTVRDYAEDDTCGTWLSSNPLEFRTDVV